MTNHSPGGRIAVLLNRVFWFVSLGGETNKEAVLTQVIVEALEALVPGITTLDHVTITVCNTLPHSHDGQSVASTAPHLMHHLQHDIMLQTVTGQRLDMTQHNL